MFRLSLKNVWAHKTRLILSMLSIVLGVAFLSGTLVFSATIQRSFDDLFSSVFKTTDAYIRSSQTELSTDGFTEIPKPISRSVVQEVEKVEGVKVAEGSVSVDNLVVIDEEGKREFSSNGPPTFGFNMPENAILNPWVLVGDDGESLTSQALVDFDLAADEVLVDKATADLKDYKIGTKIKVVLTDSVREYKIAGFARFGTADGLGGPASFLFTKEQVTDIANRGDTYTDIIVAANNGVSQEELKANIRSHFKDNNIKGLEVLTGKEITEETQADFREAIGFFTIGLMGFAIISFIVALIIIVNSFAIIMAQRKQEYALLRAVGAKSGQILTSVLIEAVIVGIVSSIVGIITGIGLAVGIRNLMDAQGLNFPSGGLVIPTSAVLTGLIVGTLATFGSAFFPAFKASRIAPIEALRESAFEKNKGWLFRSIVVGIFGAITLLLIWAAYSADDKVAPMGIAIGALFITILFAIPLLVKPFTFLIGSKVGGILLLPFGGRHAFRLTGDVVVNQVAKRNNYRNPRRTGRTALALMVGVSLVVFITVFASSITATFTKYLENNFKADIIVGGFNASTQLTPERCDEIINDEAIQGGTCFPYARLKISVQGSDDFKDSFVYGITSKHFTDVFATEFKGDMNLGESGIAIATKYAQENDLSLGDTIRLWGSAGAKDYKVQAITEEPFFDSNFAIDVSSFPNIEERPLPSFLALLAVKDGVSAEKAQSNLETILKDTGIEITDQQSLRDQQLGQINTILRVFYGLLALAIIIATIGIINTMSLSILERRRELGLIRAVGATKKQVRAFVRLESVIIAIIGTFIGVITGILTSYLFIQSLKDEGFDSFAVEPSSIIIIVILSAIIGVIAGAWPAWRATKVDVLKAITVE